MGIMTEVGSALRPQAVKEVSIIRVERVNTVRFINFELPYLLFNFNLTFTGILYTYLKKDVNISIKTF